MKELVLTSGLIERAIEIGIEAYETFKMSPKIIAQRVMKVLYDMVEKGEIVDGVMVVGKDSNKKVAKGKKTNKRAKK